MAFWFFMLVMDLLVPLTMFGFGKSFIKKAPKDINAVYGYRTSMSMKNKDTWIFAHKYFGKLWYLCGLVLIPISIFIMVLVIGQSDDMIGTVGGILSGIQIIPLVGVIIPTERALNKTFDKNGNRR